MHALISPLLRLASVGLFALPQSALALPLAAIPGAMIERPSFVIEQACGGGRKTASLEPYLVPTIEDDDDEPDEVEGKGKSKFDRPVKGRMPLSPKQPGLPDDNEANRVFMACMHRTPAQLLAQRKRPLFEAIFGLEPRHVAEYKKDLKHLPPAPPKKPVVPSTLQGGITATAASN